MRKAYQYKEKIPTGEEITKMVGKTREYDAYRTRGEKTIIINVSHIVKYTPKSLYENLKRNTVNLVTPVDQFFMISGTAYGQLIAKNYWKFSVDDLQRLMSDVKRERTCSYHIPCKDNKLIMISGRIDILDEHSEVKTIFEIKTTTQKEIKIGRAFLQAYIYKIALMQEDKEKYKDFKVAIICYYSNWKNLNIKPFQLKFVEDKEEEKRIMKDAKNLFNSVKLFWEGKPYE